ncbi:MAG: hypothetical protein GY853_16430 [PVC group bacterium]|nr:hypothetical protein [PVC group bacterium]
MTNTRQQWNKCYFCEHEGKEKCMDCYNNKYYEKKKYDNDRIGIKICESCGTENFIEDRYCGECGNE